MLTLSDSRMCAAAVDTAAIRTNARTLVQASGGLPLLADVRADGHGHGVLQAATAALEGGASWLSVSRASDAEELRAAGINSPILVSLHGGGLAPGMEESGKAPEVPRFYEPGIALYGLGRLAGEHGLVPAMRVSARVLITKKIEPGDGVSYGYTYRAQAPSWLAMVAIGYADGLDRAAGNVGSMLLAGRQRRIVGRVAMNAAVLETGDERVVTGDEAVLFGGVGEPSVDSWARSLGVSEDEVVTVFGRSLPRSHR